MPSNDLVAAEQPDNGHHCHNESIDSLDSLDRELLGEYKQNVNKSNEPPPASGKSNSLTNFQSKANINYPTYRPYSTYNSDDDFGCYHKRGARDSTFPPDAQHRMNHNLSSEYDNESAVIMSSETCNSPGQSEDERTLRNEDYSSPSSFYGSAPDVCTETVCVVLTSSIEFDDRAYDFEYDVVAAFRHFSDAFKYVAQRLNPHNRQFPDMHEAYDMMTPGNCQIYRMTLAGGDNSTMSIRKTELVRDDVKSNGDFSIRGTSTEEPFVVGFDLGDSVYVVRIGIKAFLNQGVACTQSFATEYVQTFDKAWTFITEVLRPHKVELPGLSVFEYLRVQHEGSVVDNTLAAPGFYGKWCVRIDKVSLV